MNELEKYKYAESNNPDNQGMDLFPDDIWRRAYNRGFDDVMKLELPVMFYLWIQEQGSLLLGIDFIKMSSYDLYNYWINNIYKREL